MEKIFLNPATHKPWRIEMDGQTIRTCLNGGKVKEILCDSAFQARRKAASAMMGQIITQLFRPVGIQEMQKICALGLKGFPPRLPEQPIFYPVTNQEYAAQIARDWNTKDPHSGYCGFVTSFAVDTDYLQQFKVQQVGAQVHREYWIPAEKLDEFNRHIIGVIRIEEAFYGSQYDGLTFDFQGKAIEEQIDLLEQMGIG